jgi:hypothetical protein
MSPEAFGMPPPAPLATPSPTPFGESSLEDSLLAGGRAPAAGPAADLESRMFESEPLSAPVFEEPPMEASPLEEEAALLSGDTVMSTSFELPSIEPLPLAGDDDFGQGFALPPTPVAEPAAPSAGPPVVELAVPVALGRATPGQVVERLLRVPLEYEDGTGTRRTVLEVTLRFRLE